MPQARNKQTMPDLLRFTTAGSVDDGKSTLIGRLLHDADALHDDHVEALRKKAGQLGGNMDFSLITDGLKAEREQGITIDVAYRYFSTERRRFIIADTPGHEQYTRNMATGASTADVAVILIDARQGILRQSKRHGFISSLLGVPRIVVAVNKMDLVGYDQTVFEQIRRDYGAFAAQLNFTDITFIPISALAGDNVVHHSTNMAWYDGPTLLAYLESVYIARDVNLNDFRFPVQRVVRPDQDFRGYAGSLASGAVKLGDEIVVLPSGRRSRVNRIVTMDGELESAFAPMAVTICIEDDIDISRGDMLAHPGNPPHAETALDAMIVWMSNEPLRVGSNYVLKHTTHQVKAACAEISYRVDPDTMEHGAADALGLNDIARVRISLFKPVFFDEYRRNRQTGGFILIDPITNITVGAGMIMEHVAAAAGAALTGLLGTGATLWTMTNAAAEDAALRIRTLGRVCCVIDLVELRKGLNSDLDGSSASKKEELRRASEMARLLNDAGIFVLMTDGTDAPESREMVRGIVGEARFHEYDAAAGNADTRIENFVGSGLSGKNA